MVLFMSVHKSSKHFPRSTVGQNRDSWIVIRRETRLHTTNPGTSSWISGSFNLKVLPSSKNMSVSPSTADCSWVVHSGFTSNVPNVTESQHPVKKQSDQHIWTYRTSQLTCRSMLSKKLPDSEANAYMFLGRWSYCLHILSHIVKLMLTCWCSQIRKSTFTLCRKFSMDQETWFHCNCILLGILSYAKQLKQLRLHLATESTRKRTW